MRQVMKCISAAFFFFLIYVHARYLILPKKGVDVP